MASLPGVLCPSVLRPQVLQSYRRLLRLTTRLPSPSDRTQAVDRLRVAFRSPLREHEVVVGEEVQLRLEEARVCEDYLRAHQPRVGAHTRGRKQSHAAPNGDTKQALEHVDSGVQECVRPLGMAVQLRGLHREATMDDVVSFFEGIPVAHESIVFVRNTKGGFVGQAFVAFASLRDAAQALRRDGAALGGKRIEVVPSSHMEVTVARDANLCRMGFKGSEAPLVVRLRGLPWTCTRADVLRFMSGLLVVDHGVTFLFDHCKRPTGDALVEFTSHADCERALARHRMHMGDRYIEVEGVPPRKLEAIRRRASLAVGVGPAADGARVAVRLRGLPWKATQADVERFLDGISVAPDGIVFDFDGKNRPSGYAYVVFASETDCARAFERNGQLLGKRYIDVLPSTVDQVEVVRQAQRRRMHRSRHRG